VAYDTQLFFVSVAEFGNAVELVSVSALRNAVVSEVGTLVALASISEGQFFGTVAEAGDAQHVSGTTAVVRGSVNETCGATDMIMPVLPFDMYDQVWIRTAVSASQDLWYRGAASDSGQVVRDAAD